MNGGIEPYPMISQPGVEVTWGEEHVGFSDVFADAGFREVSRPGIRRVVMRIDLDAHDGGRLRAPP